MWMDPSIVPEHVRRGVVILKDLVSGSMHMRVGGGWR